MKTKEQIEIKIARSKARAIARNEYKAAARLISGRKEKVKGENTCPAWSDPKLVAKRKAKKTRLKELKDKRMSKFQLQAAKYSHNVYKNSDKQIAAEVKFEALLLKIKQVKTKAAHQSKNDKAKHKASLIEFKSTYKRKLETTAKLAA